MWQRRTPLRGSRRGPQQSRLSGLGLKWATRGQFSSTRGRTQGFLFSSSCPRLKEECLRPLKLPSSPDRSKASSSTTHPLGPQCRMPPACTLRRRSSLAGCPPPAFPPRPSRQRCTFLSSLRQWSLTCSSRSLRRRPSRMPLSPCSHPASCRCRRRSPCRSPCMPRCLGRLRCRPPSSLPSHRRWRRRDRPWTLPSPVSDPRRRPLLPRP